MTNVKINQAIDYTNTRLVELESELHKLRATDGGFVSEPFRTITKEQKIAELTGQVTELYKMLDFLQCV